MAAKDFQSHLSHLLAELARTLCEAMERGEEAEVVRSSIFEGWGAEPVLHVGEGYPKGKMTDLFLLLPGDFGLVSRAITCSPWMVSTGSKDAEDGALKLLY